MGIDRVFTVEAPCIPLWMPLGMNALTRAGIVFRGPQAVEERKFAVFACRSCACYSGGVGNECANTGIGVSRQASYPEPAQIEGLVADLHRGLRINEGQELHVEVFTA